MSKIETRRERKKQEKKPKATGKKADRQGISRTYYYVIGFLFLVLLLLVFFIFRKSGDKVNLESERSENSALVVKENQKDPASEAKNSQKEETEAETDPEAEKAEETEKEETPEEMQTGETVTVEEDAPYDSNHATDYNDGSADRVAIKNEIMAVTGLNSDLIEWWVGNDGPGRVAATVSSRDQSEIYQVHLQYGDGQWHVVDYEKLASVPNN